MSIHQENSTDDGSSPNFWILPALHAPLWSIECHSMWSTIPPRSHHSSRSVGRLPDSPWRSPRSRRLYSEFYPSLKPRSKYISNVLLDNLTFAPSSRKSTRPPQVSNPNRRHPFHLQPSLRWRCDGRALANRLHQQPANHDTAIRTLSQCSNGDSCRGDTIQAAAAEGSAGGGAGGLREEFGEDLLLDGTDSGGEPFFLKFDGVERFEK